MASVSLYGFTPCFDPWSKRIEKQASRHHDGITSDIRVWGDRTRRELLASQNKLDDRCDGLERKIDEIGGNLDGNIVELESNMESKLDDVERGVANQFEQLERLERKMDCHIQCTRAFSHNTLCTQGWQLVKPVCRLDSEGRRIPSSHLPYTVRDFWNLKYPPQREILVKLLQYYKVQGFEEWGIQRGGAAKACSWSWGNGSTGERRGNIGSGVTPELTAAVHSHPDIAHRALALELGLSYDVIQANLEDDTASEQPGAAAPTTDAGSGPSQARKRRRSSTDLLDSPRMSEIPEFTEPVPRRTRRKRSTR
ncbi:MAG: hypothetical protein Q9173_003130 [Seirophora scorigena]